MGHRTSFVDLYVVCHCGSLDLTCGSLLVLSSYLMLGFGGLCLLLSMILYYGFPILHFGPDPGRAVSKAVESGCGNCSAGLVVVFGRADAIWLDRVAFSNATSARIRCDRVAMPAAGQSVVILFHHFLSRSFRPIASYQRSGKLISSSFWVLCDLHCK